MQHSGVDCGRDVSINLPVIDDFQIMYMTMYVAISNFALCFQMPYRVFDTLSQFALPLLISATLLELTY